MGKKITKEKIREILSLSEFNIAYISDETGVSERTVKKYLKEYEGDYKLIDGGVLMSGDAVEYGKCEGGILIQGGDIFFISHNSRYSGAWNNKTKEYNKRFGTSYKYGWLDNNIKNYKPIKGKLQKVDCKFGFTSKDGTTVYEGDEVSCEGIVGSYIGVVDSEGIVCNNKGAALVDIESTTNVQILKRKDYIGKCFDVNIYKGDVIIYEYSGTRYELNTSIDGSFEFKEDNWFYDNNACFNLGETRRDNTKLISVASPAERKEVEHVKKEVAGIWKGKEIYLGDKIFIKISSGKAEAEVVKKKGAYELSNGWTPFENNKKKELKGDVISVEVLEVVNTYAIAEQAPEKTPNITIKSKKQEIFNEVVRLNDVLGGIHEDFLGEITQIKNELSKAENEIKAVKANAEEDLKDITEKLEAEKELAIQEGIKKYIEDEQAKKKALLKKPKKGAYSGVVVSKDVQDVLEISYTTKQPCLLMGPPGCGKNTILQKLAEDKKQDVEIISITGDMTKDDFLGHYILDDMGGMVWLDGPLARGLKEGKMIIIDEINMAHQDILALLNNVTQLRDGELGAIHLAGKGGEVIIPHKDSRIFATANPTEGNLGTKDFNQATLSRFLTVNIDYLGQEDEVKLLLTKFPELNLNVVEDMVEKANKVRELKSKQEVMIDISTRHLEKTLMLMDKGMDKIISLTFGLLNDCQLRGDRFRVEEVFKS